MTENKPKKTGKAVKQEPKDLSGRGGGVDNSQQPSLDMDKLLAPVQGDNTAGRSLRYETVYDEIREARRSDDPDLPLGDWETELKKADWKSVKTLCLSALETCGNPDANSKDLQLAAWLLEALIHLYGFNGLEQGLKLINGLFRKFWKNLYPVIEKDDFDARIAPIEWLNEKLYIQLKMVPITKPKLITVSAYTMLDYDEAIRIENLPKKEGDSQNNVAEGIITKADFVKSAMLSPKSFFKELNGFLNGSLATLNAIGDYLDKKCGDQSPSLRQIRETIVETNRVIEYFYNEVEDEEEPAAAPPKAAEQTITESAKKSSVIQPKSKKTVKKDEKRKESQEGDDMQINSRDDAYNMLLEAAEFLMEHEPHSPTPYLVKRAVAWGNMTLAELLQELVDDEGNLSQLYKLLGFKGTNSESAGNDEYAGNENE